jgi:hypothetical protein
LEIETEAVQFLFWEYINGILVAVFTYMQFFLLLLFICRKDDIYIPREKERREEEEERVCRTPAFAILLSENAMGGSSCYVY